MIIFRGLRKDYGDWVTGNHVKGYDRDNCDFIITRAEM